MDFHCFYLLALYFEWLDPNSERKAIEIFDKWYNFWAVDMLNSKFLDGMDRWIPKLQLFRWNGIERNTISTTTL